MSWSRPHVNMLVDTTNRCLHSVYELYMMHLTHVETPKKLHLSKDRTTVKCNLRRYLKNVSHSM